MAVQWAYVKPSCDIACKKGYTNHFDLMIPKFLPGQDGAGARVVRPRNKHKATTAGQIR